jgi:hypothetical protein
MRVAGETTQHILSRDAELAFMLTNWRASLESLEW